MGNYSNGGMKRINWGFVCGFSPLKWLAGWLQGSFTPLRVIPIRNECIQMTKRNLRNNKVKVDWDKHLAVIDPEGFRDSEAILA